MEWVETTGKTVEEAKELALDQLGVAADEAEFEIIEAPRPGLFGRLRGEARVRSRVRPAELRPKRDRRRRKNDKPSEDQPVTTDQDRPRPETATAPSATTAGETQVSRPAADSVPSPEPDASPDEVGAAAVRFVSGLVGAMGFEATTRLQSDGTELDVVVDGDNLGLLIGPGGRTLLSIQNLARVAAQRRLGDHDTRLRVDVAGYRAKRKAALEEFTAKLAADVVESGVARALEPMPSADRKIIHDALSAIDGVSSRSEGDDPYRRVIVSPVSADES